MFLALLILILDKEVIFTTVSLISVVYKKELHTQDILCSCLCKLLDKINTLRYFKFDPTGFVFCLKK